MSLGQVRRKRPRHPLFIVPNEGCAWAERTSFFSDVDAMPEASEEAKQRLTLNIDTYLKRGHAHAKRRVQDFELPGIPEDLEQCHGKAGEVETDFELPGIPEDAAYDPDDEPLVLWR